MQAKTFTGASLEKALKDNSLTRSGIVLTGMVKASQKDGYISFTRSGCDSWVDLPSDMVEQAEHLGQNACKDHSHTVVKLTLKEPKDAEAKIVTALLAQHPQGQMQTGPIPQDWLTPGSQVSGRGAFDNPLAGVDAELGPGFLVPLRRNAQPATGGMSGGPALGGVQAASLGFGCFGNMCVCSGDADCNGMFSSGRCGGPYARCWVRGPGGVNVFCMCSQSYI